MNKNADQTLKLQSLDMTPEADPVVTLAAERACEARRAWREAQHLRLLTARRAERLARELKAAEEQTEARIAAARAAAVERREALQKRLEAATRAERLERKLTRELQTGAGAGGARASRSKAGLYVAVAAVGIAAGASVFALTPVAASLSMPGALSSASVLDGAPGAPLSLKLSYGLDARRSR